MFDWDRANEDHIADHGISVREAEEAVLDRGRVPIPAYSAEGERRAAVLGATEAGRLLIAVFTKRHGLIRVVTARDATQREKRRYRRRG